MGWQPVFAVADSDVDWATLSLWSVGLVGAGVLIAAIAKCARLAARPRANAACFVALAGVLAVWLAVGAVATLATSAVGGRLGLALNSLLYGALLALMAAALALALVGLVQLRIDPARYDRGVRQGTAAVVLAALSVLLLCGLGIRQAFQISRVDAVDRRERDELLAIVRRAEAREAETTANGETPAIGAAEAPQPPPEVVALEKADLLAAAQERGQRVEQFNYVYEPPDNRWTSMPPKAINPDASSVFTRTQPTATLMIIAEADPLVRSLTLDALAEVAKANLRSGSGGAATTVFEGDLSIHGLVGRQIVSRSKNGPLDSTVVHWIHCGNGFAYQLMLIGRREDERQLVVESQDVFRGFRQIDPGRQATPSLPRQPDYHSERFGYVVRLGESGWRSGVLGGVENPMADFEAHWGNTGRLQVFAVRLDGLDPPQEALTHSLLTAAGLTYPSRQVREERPINEGDARGVALRIELRELDLTTEVRARVLRDDHTALAAVAWLDPVAGDDLAVAAEQALDSIALEPARVVRSPTGRIVDQDRADHTAVFNAIGLYEFSAGRPVAALDFFRRAFELDGDDTTLLDNALTAFAAADQAEQGLAYLNKHRTPFVEHPELSVSEAVLQAKAGRPERAFTAYATAFKDGHRNDDAFVGFCDLLAEHGRREEAIERLEAYTRVHASVPLTTRLAVMLRESGKYSQSAELLSAQLAKSFDADLAIELAYTYEQAGRFEEQEDVCQQLLRAGHDTVATHYFLGRAQLGLEWYPQAKVSFERAARLDPADADVKDMVQHVSGLLGQGDNSSIKQPIEPVSLPEALAGSPQADDATERFRADGAYYLNSSTAVEFIPDRDMRTTVRAVARVIDQRGVDRLSTWRIDFNPLYERVFVNRLVVRSPSGDVAAEGDVANYYVTDDTSSEMATQDRLLTVPVPGLEPGGQVEIEYTRQLLSAPTRMPFEEHHLGAVLPALRRLLYLRAPTDSFGFKAIGTAPPEQAADGVYWDVAEPLVLRYEPSIADVRTFMPTVVVGAPCGSWAEEARGYMAEIHEALQSDPGVAELAERLTANAENDAAKVDSLVRHVQQGYQYRAIEFGRRGQIPNRASVVVGNRYGDCKDHSVLLVQLLRAVGVDACLALVSTTDSVIHELPSTDQFDHMLVYVPRLGAGAFFDCTDKDCDLSLPTPYGLGGKQALLLDAESPGRFVDIPELSSDANRLVCRREIELGTDGDVRIRESLEMHGHYAGLMRSYFKQVDPMDHSAFIGDLLSRNLGSASLESFQTEGLKDVAAPLVVRYVYRWQRGYNKVRSELILRLPAPYEQDILTATFVDRRTMPFTLRMPFRCKTHTTVKLPDGYAAADVDALRKSTDNKFTNWAVDVDCQGSLLTLTAEVDRRAGVFGPEAWADYRKALDDVVAALTPGIHLHPEPGPPPFAE